METKITVHSQKGKGESFTNKQQGHMPQQKKSQQNPTCQNPTQTTRINKNFMGFRQRFSDVNHILSWQTDVLVEIQHS